MSHPLRIQDKEQVYYVSNICIQQLYLFLPTDKVNEIILGCINNAKIFYGCEVFVFGFLLNQYGMLVRASALNLPEFMRSFQSRIATEINLYHGRKGKFFEGRYYKSDVLDTKTLLERVNDITLGPVKAGLVEHVEDWPGVNSWRCFNGGMTASGRRLNRSEYRRLKRKTKNKRKKYEMPEDAGMEDFRFVLDRLPGFEELTDAEYCAMIRKMVNERSAVVRKENADQKIKYMGLKKIMKLTWKDGPKKYEDFEKYGKEIRPISMGPKELREAHLAKYKRIAKEYGEAMRAYVEDYDASKFPLYTCRPGLIKCEKPDDFPKPDDPPSLDGSTGDLAHTG